jgi:hypothetical protein
VPEDGFLEVNFVSFRGSKVDDTVLARVVGLRGSRRHGRAGATSWNIA